LIKPEEVATRYSAPAQSRFGSKAALLACRMTLPVHPQKATLPRAGLTSAKGQLQNMNIKDDQLERAFDATVNAASASLAADRLSVSEVQA